MLDPVVSPEEIMSREGNWAVKSGPFLLQVVQRTLSLRLPSTAVETTIA